jgi:hypothetical protein
MSKHITTEQVIENVRFTFVAQARPAKWSAANQRELFGAAVFGKKDFRYDNAKRLFTVRIHVCYGSDSIDLTVTPEMVAEAVNTGRKIEHDGAGHAVIR